jgi:putative membrane protein insertion efficiency factor
MLERLAVKVSAHSTDAVLTGDARRTSAGSIASPPAGWLSRALGQLLIGLIRVYQWTLGPLLGNCCRFEPSCSRYAAACIEHSGPVRGSFLGLRRVLRCHPLCEGGYDPPPGAGS